MQKGMIFFALFAFTACMPFGEKPIIPNGRVIAYTADGQKRYEKEWHEKKRHGIWRDYTNNKLKEEYSYQDGVRTGVWKSWYANGQQKSQANYKNDLEEGEWITWHENGKKSFDGHYVSGKKQGHFHTYDESGDLLEDFVWENGVALKPDNSLLPIKP